MVAWAERRFSVGRSALFPCPNDWVALCHLLCHSAVTQHKIWPGDFAQNRPMEVYLAHGASGSAASMQPHVDGLRARGISAHAVELPVGRAEKAVSVYARQVGDLARSVIGGHSYG